MEIQDVWLWEMEMCCSMELEALRKKMSAYQRQRIAPGTVIDSGMYACPMDETLFEGIVFRIVVHENGQLEVIGRVRYWHPVDGGWDMSASLKTFNNLKDCNQWLKDEHSASREECALILKEKCKD